MCYAKTSVPQKLSVPQSRTTLVSLHVVGSLRLFRTTRFPGTRCWTHRTACPACWSIARGCGSPPDKDFLATLEPQKPIENL